MAPLCFLHQITCLVTVPAPHQFPPHQQIPPYHIQASLDCETVISRRGRTMELSFCIQFWSYLLWANLVPDNVIPICTQDDAPQSTLPSFRPGCVIIAIFYGQVTVDSMSNTRYKEHDRSLSNHYTLLCGALLSVWKEFGKLKVAVVRTPCHFKRQDNRRTNLDHHTNNVSSPGGVTAITYKKLVISNRGYLYDWYSAHFG